VGEDFYNTQHLAFNAFKTTADAAEFIKQQHYQNQLVFIKGSRGMKLETLAEFIS
jgi:UDP-N-acetylmuramoyl-tripeptide--D-alanyl-D-alanine ligase